MVLFDNKYLAIVQYGLSAPHYACSRGDEKAWQLLEKNGDVHNVKNGVSFNAYSFNTASGFFISCFNCRIIGQLLIYVVETRLLNEYDDRGSNKAAHRINFTS